jgi:alpha-N-arabinofuranosidase
VNVIAPIMTAPGGPAWRQTIFYPFLHASRYGRGSVLETAVDSAGYETQDSGMVTWLESIAVLGRGQDGIGGEITIFAVNRHPHDPLRLTARLGGFTSYRLIEHLVMSHPDPLAVNDEMNPLRVVPVKADGARVENEDLEAVLAPYSWNVIRIGLR